MVDSALLASKLSAIRDAVERIRVVLPESADVFLNDRTKTLPPMVKADADHSCRYNPRLR